MIVTSLIAIALLGQGEQAPSLAVGSTAPPIKANDWVHGPAVRGFRKGKVYLVEFWATWCSPCMSAMSHLASLRERYAKKGLEIVALTQLDKWGSTREAVSATVKKFGKDMAFSVGIDP